MNHFKPLIFVLAGMTIGAVVGFLIFGNIDHTKGWNPYGWWFAATFIFTIFCGLAGLFLSKGFRKR